ncbi:hypothetical protein [Chitinophaga caseinilytica]|uniref:hypothetical protein n=1 Tax=Chitinophaga caseinilytica TaxID=2267521 RepID=UPI003C30D020
MKNTRLLLLVFFASCFGRATGQIPEEKVIRDFMTYVSSPSLDIDTIDLKYVVPYPVDTPVGTKYKRQELLRIMAFGLKNHIKTAELKTLKIVPYKKAPEELQDLILDEDLTERAFVAFDGKKFARYFLIKDSQIQAFDRLGFAFLVMD